MSLLRSRGKQLLQWIREIARIGAPPNFEKFLLQGDSELRRLLFNAAMQGRRNALWEPYYLTLRSRGMSTTAAFVAPGQKLARVCFSLLKNGINFNPEVRKTACSQT